MIGELKRYPAYHSAESTWLGEMPVGWQAIQLARINTKLTNGFVGPTRNILRENGVRYLQSLHIKGGNIIFDTPYFVSEEWSAAHKKSVLETGDVLIVQTGDIGQVAAVTDEFAGCNCHALIIICAKPQIINGFFLSAVLRSHYGFHSLKQIQTGALHPHLNCTYIRDILLPVPPLEEQRAILTFLDRETEKIDRLLEVRRKQLELLQEQRNAVIHNAVTNGLDANAPLKPSGIEWLGDVNCAWANYDIKHIAEVIAGGTPKSSENAYWDGEVVWLTPADLGKENARGIGSSARTLTGLGQSAAALDLLPVGTLVMSTRAPVGSMGILAVEATTNQGCKGIVFNWGQADGRFFFYMLSLAVPFLNSVAQGATFVELSGFQLKNLTVACPDVSKQREIADWLDGEMMRFGALAAKYLRELELLAEYRASLISHAVTGEIDVRAMVTTTPEQK
jgi:type I restriction enzyme S subunit